MRKRILALIISMIMTVSCFGAAGVLAADQQMNFDKGYSMMNNMFSYLISQTPQNRDYLYDWVHSYMKTDLGVDAMISLVDDQAPTGNNTVVQNFIYSFGVSDAQKADLRFALSLAKCIPTEARAKAFGDMKNREQFSLDVTTEQSEAIDYVYNQFLTAEQQAVLNDDEHKIEKNVIMQFLADLNKTFVLTDAVDRTLDFDLYKLNSEFKSKIESGELKTKYATVNSTDWKSAEEFIGMFISSLNTSSKFDDTMKEKFKTVLGIPGIDMYVARVFDVDVKGNVTQIMGNTEDVVFTAKSNIETDDLSKVKWYVNGAYVATGKSFTCNPFNFVGGDSANLSVIAIFGEYERGNIIKIVPEPEYTLNISQTGELNQFVGSESEVVFKATVTPEEATDLNDTQWYVNNILQQTTGAEFKFTPSGKGEYVVKAILNGAKSEEIKINVAEKSITIKAEDESLLNQKSNNLQEVVVKIDESASYITLEDAETAKWYINDVDQQTTGKEFKFTPSGTGEYTIVAKTDDEIIVSNKVIVKVTTKISTGDNVRPITPGISVTDRKEPEEIKGPTTTDRVNQFTDLEGHWAEAYMEFLYEKGIFSGTSETTMDPDLGVTRQEIAVLLTKMLGYDNEIPFGNKKYTDDEDIASWAKNSVYVLSERGIYAGYDDGSFKPKRIISRQEFVSLLGRHLSGNYSDELNYTDAADIYYWAVEDVKELTYYGIVSGYPDGTFRPLNDITRAEAAVIIYNTLYRVGKI